MRAAILSVLLLSSALASNLKDLGSPGWTCPAAVMAKSASVPTNVNSVRFADIKVVAAMGDSLTAANGAGASPGDPVGVILQYRGLAFQIGGDKSLDQHITIPNILRKFNPNVFGYSKGIGAPNVWENSRLNQGFPGAESSDMPGQARLIVNLMQQHPENVDMANDWKLVNIFIGANDICAGCDDAKYNRTSHSKAQFKKNLQEAIQILMDNLPRTIVSLTGMLDMAMVRKIDKGKYFCDALHVFECHCESDQGYTDTEIANSCFGYQDDEMDLQTSGQYDKDDFTLVIQPFFQKITEPPRNADGTVDLSFFAADCFHFSQFGHSVIAKNLWNNIVQPVGKKTVKANLSDQTGDLVCPDASCPFFPTVKNSANCAAYMTAHQSL